MPRPRAGRSYGGNRAGKIGKARIYRGVDTPMIRKPDPNAGREGFAPCGTCGVWVRLRADGALKGHRFMEAPCIGSYSRVEEDEHGTS